MVYFSIFFRLIIVNFKCSVFYLVFFLSFFHSFLFDVENHQFFFFVLVLKLKKKQIVLANDCVTTVLHVEASDPFSFGVFLFLELFLFFFFLPFKFTVAFFRNIC